MIVRIIVLLSITLNCSDSEFGATITPQPTATATGDVEGKKTAVTSGVLVANESGSVVKVWEHQGKPLLDVGPIVITGGKHSKEIKMTYNTERGSTQKTQHDRIRTEIHPWKDQATTIEGSERYRQSETIQQRPLDVLLVVDISGSMGNERKGLGTRLSRLLQHIKGSQWKVAITTTDVGKCLLREWIIDKQASDAEDRFKKIISGDVTPIDNNNGSGQTAFCGEICVKQNDHPSKGGGEERPILMAINGLGGSENIENKHISWCRGRRSETQLNNDWLRNGSMVAVILVTDEDNSEHPKNQDGNYQKQIDLNTSQLTNYLENTLGRKKGITYQIYGLTNPLARESYKNIIDDANMAKVKNSDYDTVLSNISTGIMNVLNTTLNISNIAQKTGFKFKGIEGRTKGTHYTINNNIITFVKGHVPAKNTSIIVKYSYTEPVTTKAKALSHRPLPGTVEVTKVSGCGTGGITSEVGTCNNNTVHCVIHGSRPQNGCLLKYTYKRADLSLYNNILLDRPNDECTIVESTIRLTVGGSSRSYNYYNENSRQLSFAPKEDDDKKEIVANYTCRKKVLSYSYPNTNNSPVTCQRGNKTIACTYSDGEVTISATDFEVGKFVAEHPIPPTDRQIELEDGYVADSLSLEVTDNNGQKTTCDASKLVIENNIVPLDSASAKQKCSALDSMHKVSLTYQRQQEHSFEIGSDFFNANPHNDQQWQVVINGKELATDAYELDKEARTVKLKSVPPPGANIEIKVDLLW